MREPAIDLPHEKVSRFRHCVIKRSNLKAIAGYDRVRQLLVGSELFYSSKLALEQPLSCFQKTLAVDIHGQAECLLFPLFCEARRWH